ncbi:beta-galactosidase-1-like protein 2 [Euwallacea similis]|uniref:beta-galactosidase-1-like protein 2 n=1 Tax=Euwallacea similis TaxID=1736056 RepID=UPI00344E17CF
MEKIDINEGSGQSNGYIVYRIEKVDLKKGSILTVEDNVCDHVLVLVFGELIAPKQLKYLEDLNGFDFYRLKDSNLILNENALEGATVDLVVEEWGRMNGGKYFQYNQTFKGLWQGDVKINNEKVSDWKIIPLELKKQWVNELKGWQNISKPLTDLAMYSSILKIDNEPLDTFIDIRGWGKGMAFVNGFPLGRYAAIGPQRTLYLPGPFLNKAENQINFLEHFYAPADGLLKFSDKLAFEDVH